MSRFFDEAPDLVRIVGTVFGGRYRIVRPLGEGGMSAVFLAEDLKLPGKKWAVKRTREYGISELSAAREAAVLMKLSHPYLPHVVDFFPPDELGYSHLVLEYIDGVTLQQLFAQSGDTLPVQSLIRYSIQLCELLQYLHELDSGPVIFRDIKPSNIMIDARDHVRLIDFGIARKQKPGRMADTIPLGTIGFAAPEVLEHGCSDSRSDLYSLGATLYYLMSGGRTYNTVREHLVLAGNARERMLADLVAQLLADNPEHRPESAAEVKSRLENSLESEKVRLSSANVDSFVPLRELRRIRIAVGALYSGAGATFTAMAIAALLSEAGIANAVIEHPGIRPDLYGLLNGERNSPPNYDYWASRHDDGSIPWKTGRTEWIAINPNDAKIIHSGNLEQRLYRINAAVTIVDVGDRWLESDMVDLLEETDVIVAVADPLPSRWMTAAAREHAELLMKRHDAGRQVHFFANKSVSFSGDKEWLASFPLKPSAVIPNIPFEETVRSSWKGEPVQTQTGVKVTLQKALAGWIGTVVGTPGDFVEGRSGKSWLGKFFSAKY